MKSTSENKLPYLIIIILGAIFVFLFYGKVLLSPNNYIFSNSGDGIKNYFTYAYHIKHGSAYTNFEGMNYPYGEHYMFTDCHPVLANTFKCLSKELPFFETHSIGLLNLLMVFSIFITIIIVYLLLLELKLDKWLSIIFSFGITILAPQLFRMGGHLSMSYSLAIPLAWLLTLKFIRKQGIIYLALIFLSNLFWMFIHAYLGIIVISFVFTIVLLKILSDKDKKNRMWGYIWLGIGILLPVVLFFLHLKLSDSHIGRTNNPSGFFLYNAEIDDILIPHGKPFRPWLDKLTGGIIKLEWEAWGYVGMINTLFFITLVIISIGAIFSRNAKTLLKKIFSNRIINISLIASSIVLLFALAIPFKQFPGLLELFPIFKPFRATGRFVWPFYFGFTVFSAFVFQEIIINSSNSGKRRIASVILLVSYISLQSIEAFHYHSNVSDSITKSPNLFSKEQLPEYIRDAINAINPGDYQAILSMPFYYQGSESYSRPRQDEAVRNSLIFSYHTGIPNVCANLTRTSVEESKRIVQVVSPNYYNKKIADDITSTKPFLIIKTGENFTQYENAILHKGATTYKRNNLELLMIGYEELFRDDTAPLNSFNEALPNLIKQDSFYVSKNSPVLYYNSYENSKSDTVFRGKGSFVSIKKGKNLFAEFPPNSFEKGKEYDLSLWMHNGVPDALNLWFRLIVEEHDETNNKWYTTTFFPEQTETISENWSLVEGVFRVNDPKNKIYIVSKGKENSKATLHADDLLIKERGVEVYRIDNVDSTLFFNNHKIRLR